MRIARLSVRPFILIAAVGLAAGCGNDTRSDGDSPGTIGDDAGTGGGTLDVSIDGSGGGGSDAGDSDTSTSVDASPGPDTGTGGGTVEENLDDIIDALDEGTSTACECFFREWGFRSVDQCVGQLGIPEQITDCIGEALMIDAEGSAASLACLAQQQRDWLACVENAGSTCDETAFDACDLFLDDASCPVLPDAVEDHWNKDYAELISVS